jgi:hypothetical protein
MGVFGGSALAVNVAAAVVLVSGRTRDANARASWLFFRNDALEESGRCGGCWARGMDATPRGRIPWWR